MIRLRFSLVLIMTSILMLILVACGTAGPAVYDDAPAVGNDSQESVEENKESPAESNK